MLFSQCSYCPECCLRERQISNGRLASQHADSPPQLEQDPATPGALNRKMMQKIVNVEYTFPPNPELSRECKDFVSKIFTKDPKDRIRTAEMRRHPWFAVDLPAPVISIIHSILSRRGTRPLRQLLLWADFGPDVTQMHHLLNNFAVHASK